MDFNEVVWYNHYGWGDIYASREMVREISKNISAKKIYYAHAKDKDILFDFPEFGFTPLSTLMDMRRPFTISDGRLLINTWIGYAGGKYVFPGVTCSMNNYKQMFNDTLAMIGIDFRLTKSRTEYIPNPDISFLKKEYINNIDKFLFYDDSVDYTIIISNGDVQSNQAYNFDFTPIILTLADKYKNIRFIITQKFEHNLPNISYTGDIIKKTNGADLNEIGYLSWYTDIIIGRSSGPYVFCQTHDNYHDYNKSILSFTYEEQCAHMIDPKESNARLYWSSSISTNAVIHDIERVISERINK